MDTHLTDSDLIDGAACAASDLTARLLAELAQAQAQLAISDARAHAALAIGQPVPKNVRTERVLQRRQVAVIRQILDGVPSVSEDNHAASA